MKIIVGKKYRVKSWEKMEEEYGSENGVINTPASFTPLMEEYCGKMVTIKNHCYPEFYRVIEDNGRFYWDEYMLERSDSIEYYLELRDKISN